MSLSQLAINNAKPKDKPYLLSDGDGLHLRIHPKGGRQWRLRFRFGGKPNMMSLGPYPAVSLLQARRRRDRAKEQLAAGINPSLGRKLEELTTAAAAQSTFGAVADESVTTKPTRRTRKKPKHRLRPRPQEATAKFSGQ